MYFFFNDTATTEIYTLSLHDALPISTLAEGISVNVTLIFGIDRYEQVMETYLDGLEQAKNSGVDLSTLHSVASFLDRKSTRLNSSHANISYAVFCLKKKNNRTCRLIL